MPFILRNLVDWRNIFEVSKTVLWKRLNTETSQRGNASKTGFEDFMFFWGNPSKLKNVEGFPIIFEAFPNI